jgi:hypothetical protein
VTSYKEVAEHVGLLSGSSSEEEKDKDEDVEDVTDFDQGECLLGGCYREAMGGGKREKVVDYWQGYG